MGEKFTIEEAKGIAEDKGYELLSSEYKGINNRLRVKDKEGYIGFLTLEGIQRGYSFHKYNNSNLYNAYNIKIYLKDKVSCDLLSVYMPYTHYKLKWKCMCGEIFYRSFSNVKRGQDTCLNCSFISRITKRKLEDEDVLKLVHDCGFKLHGHYINATTNLKLEDKDGYLYSLIIGLLRNRKSDFNKFSFSNEYTIHNIKLWLKLNNKPFTLLSSDFETTHSKLKFKCNTDGCGEIFEKSTNNLTISQTRCPYCTGQLVGVSNSLKTRFPEVAKEFDIYKNNGIKPSEIHHGSKYKFWWICSKCSNEWEAIVESRTRLNTGCPECASSTGEKRVSYILNKYCVDYESEYSFYDLHGLGGGLLRFDFCIFKDCDKSNILALCEFDGEFHYEKIFKDDNFEILQKHDKLKNEYCEKHNIKLIRIPYWDFDNIEEILVKELGLDVNIHK